MTHVIRLTHGSEQINLMGTIYARNYVPGTPDLSTIDFTPEALGDGGERIFTSRRNVSESMELMIGGSSRDAVIANINLIERALAEAERYQYTRAGSPVYLEMQPDQAASSYRTEIFGGKLQLGQNALSYEWRNNLVTGVMFFTRRYYWEGNEIELPLWNVTADDVTGGIEVSNQDDEVGYYMTTGACNISACRATMSSRYMGFGLLTEGNSNTGAYNGYFTLPPLVGSFRATVSTKTGVTYDIFESPMDPGDLVYEQSHVYTSAGSVAYYSGPYYGYGYYYINVPDDWILQSIHATYIGLRSGVPQCNWVGISGSDINGAIKTPLRLEYYKTDTLEKTRKVIAGMGASGSAKRFYEAEDAGLNATLSPSVASDPYGSNLWKAGIALPTTSASLMSWYMYDLSKFKGEYYRVMARILTPQTNVRLSVKTYSPNTNSIIAQTPEVTLTNSTDQLVNLGVMQLPPWLSTRPGSVGYLYLSLFGYRPTTSCDLWLDYITLMPTESWRVYTPTAACMETYDTLVDNGPENLVYIEKPGGYEYGTYAATGVPIEVYPGSDHVLYLMSDATSGSCETGLQMTIRAYYRPRKLTL